MPAALNAASFRKAVRILTGRDPDLAALVDRHGPPPFWVRPAGFPTLLHIILEQQVSLASAQATFDRLRLLADPLTPESLLALPDEALRGIGFSRQKIRYCRIAAQAILNGDLPLDHFDRLPDEEVRGRLTALTGIGPWTADIYLQMALRRPDVWPVGDLALRVAVQRFKGLAEKPVSTHMEAIGEAWRPYRSVAAGILWHGYLNWG